MDLTIVLYLAVTAFLLNAEDFPHDEVLGSKFA